MSKNTWIYQELTGLMKRILEMTIVLRILL